MKSHAKSALPKTMVIKRVLDFKGALGVILPREMTRALGLSKRSKVGIVLLTPDTITITRSNKEAILKAIYAKN